MPFSKKHYKQSFNKTKPDFHANSELRAPWGTCLFKNRQVKDCLMNSFIKLKSQIRLKSLSIQCIKSYMTFELDKWIHQCSSILWLKIAVFKQTGYFTPPFTSFSISFLLLILLMWASSSIAPKSFTKPICARKSCTSCFVLTWMEDTWF